MATYNIPLTKRVHAGPKYVRAKKAISAIKAFAVRHAKTPDVKLGVELNEFVWKDGIRNPPNFVKVNIEKTDKGATVELFGVVKKEALKVSDKTAKKSAKAPKADAVEAEVVKETPSAETKPKKKTAVKKNVAEEKAKAVLATEKVPTAAELKAKKESANN